jgi:hypothetical protein
MKDAGDGPRDHRILVSGDGPDLDATDGWRAQRRVVRVALPVELDAEKAEAVTDPLADDRRVFADAGGEDERIQAAARRRRCRSISWPDNRRAQQLRPPGRRWPRARVGHARRSWCRTRRAAPIHGSPLSPMRSIFPSRRRCSVSPASYTANRMLDEPPLIVRTKHGMRSTMLAASVQPACRRRPQGVRAVVNSSGSRPRRILCPRLIVCSDAPALSGGYPSARQGVG